MLRNPDYVLSLVVAFALGFVAVLALPVGGADMRVRFAMQEPAGPGGASIHYKSRIGDSASSVQVAAAQSAGGPEDIRAPLPPAPRSRWSYPSMTKLVALAAAPFPYRGIVPRTRARFLNVKARGREGRKTRSGKVYWADKTYNDPRALLHIPRGFDPSRPSVMVLFFHGMGATLARDVVARQRLPAQISESGTNAILVAPQFAVDARDASAGNFWKEGGTRRFLEEVSQQLAKLQGDPQSAEVFAKMPVVVVGYSGGYVPTAWTLANGGIENRIKGVVLLDGLYGEIGKFANWIERGKTGFFLSANAKSTRKGNASLKRMLKRRGVAYNTKIGATLTPGSVTFVEAVKRHRDYVTRAWSDNPVSDMLRRLPWVAPRSDPARSASLAPSLAR